jgi:radical SAM protein with 4Fe4S-binding SPASM domain
MFNYDYFEDFVKKLIICNSAPLQVELQPGKGCGGYNCKFCYGYNQELTSGEELTTEEYYKLLDDLKEKVKFITLAGIKSDPLNNKYAYDIIKRIKENGFRLGIHTKGLLLNPHISNLLNTNTDYGDFITFSVDASDKSVYNSLHGLPEDSKFFDIIKKNISYLYERKKSTKSDLNVNMSYLLFKDNSSKEQMERFVQLFGDMCDRIRFSLPQVPNKVDEMPDYYLNSPEEIKKIIEYLKKKYPDKKIIFLDFNDHAHQTNFKYCYAQRFQAVIDHCGYVYPCPQITTKQFQQITYGNIKNRSFWDVWNSDNKKRIFDTDVEKLACRICDRKDEALNTEFSKTFNNEKVS